MTVHRVTVCSCGHDESWHANGSGPCTYGHDHSMGGCSCDAFSRRRRPDSVARVPRPNSNSSIISAIDKTIRALTELRGALSEVDRPQRSVVNGATHAHQPPRASKRAHSTNDESKLRAGERRTLVGIAGSGSTFGTYLGALLRHGLVDRAGELRRNDLVVVQGNRIRLGTALAEAS